MEIMEIAFSQEENQMMPELSLNILDVAQNSVTAGASLIEITIT